MIRISLAACLCALLTLSLPAAAHHSAAQYDFAGKITLQGKVKRVRFANPHLELVLEVSDAKGKRDIPFEGHSMNNFYRAGWRKDLVREGDLLTVTVAPMKDKTDGGYVTNIKTADGHQF